MRGVRLIGVTSMAIAFGLFSAGCGGNAGPAPTFRKAPPFSRLEVAPGALATSSVGVLMGKVYCAASEQIDAKTGLPVGYGLLPDGDTLIYAEVAGSRASYQAPIASGSYELDNLPLGVALAITATKRGYQPRTQTLTLSRGGIARLSFDFAGDPNDAYLLPQPGNR